MLLVTLPLMMPDWAKRDVVVKMKRRRVLNRFMSGYCISADKHELGIWFTRGDTFFEWKSGLANNTLELKVFLIIEIVVPLV